MSFRTRRVILSSPFILILVFFVMKYFFALFGGLDDSYLISLTLVFGIMRIGSMLFEEKKSRRITRTLDEISQIWLWLSFFFAMDLAIIYLIGFFVDFPFIVVVLFLAIVPIIAVYSYFKAHKIVVNEETIILDNIDEDINIVHLSDVHFGSIRHEKIIRDICDKLNELSKTCDLAIISGDLADGSCVVEEDDFLPFKDIDIPIIFTSGNHDYYPGIENVYRACKKAGIIILDNKGMEFGELNIFGIPFSFGDVATISADELKSFIREDKVNIINFHVPQNWEEFKGLGFDIQLSGHTHGGQFYPVVWIGDRIWNNRGLFKSDLGGKDKYLHVTTGVGSMDYPFRWGTDSELVVLKLRKK